MPDSEVPAAVGNPVEAGPVEQRDRVHGVAVPGEGAAAKQVAGEAEPGAEPVRRQGGSEVFRGPDGEQADPAPEPCGEPAVEPDGVEDQRLHIGLGVPAADAEREQQQLFGRGARAAEDGADEEHKPVAVRHFELPVQEA